MASIGLTAGIYAPLNTALCQGQLMPVSQNTALSYLLGPTYGGNGTT
ncbi:MAG: tail fiber protein, partial [Actinomycetota bacterium]